MTLQQLAVPVQERIRQLLINIERCRWVPEEQKGDYLVVNIPAFKLLVYRNDSIEFSSNVIVGETAPAHNTLIFNSNLEFIVFNPYWNIPENILRDETLPEIIKDPGYLEKHDMEVTDAKGNLIEPSSVDWRTDAGRFPYIIRQRPGINNALGLVKFLFPNPYDIYMHDTPQKSLFGETTRTFSHGCIRLEEPFRLVEYLLAADKEWTAEKIDSCVAKGKETFVRLDRKIPIFISYFTAWVDRNGKLNFRDDIYHHDEKMKQLLFGEKSLAE